MIFICVSVTDGQLLGIGLGDIDPSRKQLSASSDGRPKSCCEVPRVPGIKYVPSMHCSRILSEGFSVLCLQYSSAY
jgi:hypothetical protein